MDIQLEKLSLIQMLQDTNDFEIIVAMKDIFKSKKKIFGMNLILNKNKKLNIR